MAEFIILEKNPNGDFYRHVVVGTYYFSSRSGARGRALFIMRSVKARGEKPRQLYVAEIEKVRPLA